MWDDDDVITATAGYFVISIANQTKRKKRKCWVRPTLLGRNEHGGSQLMTSLLKDDQFTIGGHFLNFIRMPLQCFEELHPMVEPIIKKRDTNLRCAIPSKERLLVTLRFLATGDSYQSLMLLFKISKQAISLIIPEVCGAINEVLRNQVQVSKIMNKICYLMYNINFFIK